MLQSSFFDPVLGVDIHIVLVPTPAGPVPTPVPMPFVGMVFDPAGLAIGAAMGMATGGGPGLVLINSMPVTNAGTNVTNTLTMPHLPVPGVAFAKGLPGNDAELFFGSLNVNLAGSLGVRLGEIAMSCSDPVRLPTSVVLAIPKGMPVLNMSAPVPDVAGIAQRLAMLGAMRLLRAVARGGARIFRALRAAQRRSRGWQRVSGALRSVVDRIAPQRFRDRLRRAVCFVTGHPVDVATGRLFTDNIDFELPGPLPLVFERVYSSSLSWRNGTLGYGWSHSLDQQVWVEPGKVVLLSEDGREIEFHTGGLPGGALHAQQSLYESTNRLTLKALGPLNWEVESSDGVVREFAHVAGGDSGRARLQRVRSRDGHHSIQLTYDARGLLEWVRDCGGRLIGFKHDKQRRLAEVKLPLSRESSFYRHLKYVYGASGDLVEVVDAAGNSWKFEYQGHLLVQETDRTGLSFYFQYDGWGASARCVRTWGDGGIYDHVISYDSQNRKTVVENSLGAVTVYQMDELGMVVKVVDPHGATTQYAYDEGCGELAKETNALGHSRVTAYDNRGQPKARRGPDGAISSVDYDTRGLPIRAADATQGVWHWDYDTEGNLVESVMPTGERTRYGWKRGLLIWVEEPGRPRTSLEYDKHTNLIRARAGNGVTTEYVYDAQGRAVQVRDAHGATVRRRYDSLGRLVLIESPTGAVQEMRYDAGGNLIELRSATRHFALTYGHFSKVVAREEAGTTVRFLYDTEDRLTATINEAGEVYTFVRDACGRVLKEKGFDERIRSYQRDLLGQVEKTYLPSGRSTQYTYDPVGRLVKVAHSDGTGAEFTYRADGALLRAKNESTEVTLERDAMGRVLREVQGGHSVVSLFNAYGERTLMETSLGGRMAVVRDGFGEMIGVRLGKAHVSSAHLTVTFERDSFGLETARELPGGIRLEWERDMAGRPVERRTVRHSTTGNVRRLETRTYEWYGEDQITAITDSALGRTLYHYDARARLIGQETGAGTLHRTTGVVGDVYHSSTGSGRRYGSGVQPEVAGGARYAYDEDGNQIERVSVEGEVWRYKWSGAGLLSEVERPDGLRVRFAYDAFARRTLKALVRVGPEGKESVEKEMFFVWDRDTLVHELSSNQEPITWYWEPETFTPIVKEQAGRCWATTPDHLGTPTALYDETGHLAWKMDIDVSGNYSLYEGASETCPWRWPGQYEDAETGLRQNWHRYFDPIRRQYLSQDPMGLYAGIDLYGYAADPNVWADPWGLIIVYHYTSKSGYDAITTNAKNWHLKASSPPGGRPYGVYVTTMPPTSSAGELARMRIPAEKRAYYLAIEVADEKFDDLVKQLPGGRGEAGISLYFDKDVHVPHVPQNEWNKKSNRPSRTVRQAGNGKCG